MKISDKRNSVRPVKRIELSEKHVTLRMVIIVLAICTAVVAFLYALISLLNTEPGWQEVEANTAERNCSQDFKLQYYFGASGMNATAENKQLSLLYTEAMENAYIIFSKDEKSATVNNLCYVNEHVNEELEVDPALWQALATVKRCESRYIYMAPVYVEYNRMFLCENAQEAAQYDPAQNEELTEYISQLAAFANSAEHIDLEILDNNRVCLHVSEEYLAFAKEYEIYEFLDFSWTKNAFIVDYVADLMSEKGYKMGCITSYDGFTRNLDTAGNAYSLNIFDRVINEVHLPARMEYKKPISIVQLRNFPFSERDNWHYYSFEQSIATIFLDPTDGMSKSSTDCLTAYSYERSCAEVLLESAPLFIADSFDDEAIAALARRGVYSLWCEEQEVRYNDSELTVMLNADAAVQYTTLYVGEE